MNEGVQYIGTCAFMSCKNLKQIDLPKSIVSIDNWAFSGTSIQRVVVPPDVDFPDNGSAVFPRCLEYIELHESIKEIPEELFVSGAATGNGMGEKYALKTIVMALDCTFDSDDPSECLCYNYYPDQSISLKHTKESLECDIILTKGNIRVKIPYVAKWCTKEPKTALLLLCETDHDKCKELFDSVKNTKLKPALAVMLSLKGMDDIVADYMAAKSKVIIDMLMADDYFDTIYAIKEKGLIK